MRLRRARTDRSPYEGLAFFRGWSGDDLARLDRVAEVLRFAPGEALVAEGGVAREVLVLVEGEADLVHARRTEGALGPGDTVGVEALLTSGPRTSTVVARTPVTALYLGQREFHGLLQEAPSFGRALSRTLADRLVGLPATA